MNLLTCLILGILRVELFMQPRSWNLLKLYPIHPSNCPIFYATKATLCPANKRKSYPTETSCHLLLLLGSNSQCWTINCPRHLPPLTLWTCWAKEHLDEVHVENVIAPSTCILLTSLISVLIPSISSHIPVSLTIYVCIPTNSIISSCMSAITALSNSSHLCSLLVAMFKVPCIPQFIMQLINIIRCTLGFPLEIWHYVLQLLHVVL